MKKCFSIVPAAVVCAVSFSAFCGGAPSSKSNAYVNEPPVVGHGPTGGDPVGYIDGGVYDSVEDVRIPCPDIDLVFRRSYSSLSAKSGSLGYGWRHSYEWSVEETESGVVVRSAGERGASDVVLKFDTPPQGGSTFNADGYELRFEMDGTRKVVTPGALTYAFDTSGRLASITSWNGTSVQIERNAGGRVERAVHSNGRWLGFEYAGDGMLSRVVAPDADVSIDLNVGGHENCRMLTQVVRYDHGRVSSLRYSYASVPVPGARDVYSASLPSFSKASSVSGGLGAMRMGSGDKGLAGSDAAGSGGSFSASVSSTGGGSGSYSGSGPSGRSASSGNFASSSGTGGGSSLGDYSFGKVPSGASSSSGGFGEASGEYGQSQQVSAADSRPVLCSKTDANGITTTYEYSRPGDAPQPKCSHSEMSGGLFATHFTYGSRRTTELKSTAGGTVSMCLEYNSDNRETSRVVGAESVRTDYDENGDRTSIRLRNALSGASSELRASYDGRHRPVSIGYGYGSAPEKWYSLEWDDLRNALRRVETPEGRVAEWTTNGLEVVVHGAGTNDARRVARILTADGERPLAVVFPDGERIDVSYDDCLDVTNLVCTGLPSVSLEYDGLGHVNRLSLPGPEGTERVYSMVNNWRGNALSVSLPDGTSQSYQYEGNGRRVTRRVDALGRVDVFAWVLGRPLHVGRVVNGVTNSQFAVAYDKQLNVVAITDPLGRGAETYAFDGNERIVAVTNLEGQVMTRKYAVGGVVSSETRFDGTEVSYGYDSDGNLASVAYPDETLAFTYDGDGLLLSASSSAGAVSNVFDAATGWLDASTGADGTTVSYSRSNGGSVTSMASVAGTTTYSHDAAGRISHIASSSGQFGFGYCDWNGRLSAVTNGSGFMVKYMHDIMDRVTNISWRTTSGAAIGGFEYEYDAAGRIVSRSHALGDPSQMSQSSQKNYTYDDLDRLASDGDVFYTYDAAGNRMTKTEDGETITYTLGVGDRLASWTGGAYSYDAAGNVTRIERDGRPTLDLTWNSQYQLVSVSTNGVFAEGYAYDALCRRVSTTTQEGTTRHVYDNNWQVIADLDEDGDVIASYTWGEGIDNLLAVNIDGATYYPLTDIQGTVWGYVDSQNNVVARWQYDAWGNVVDEEIASYASALANIRYRFQGREWSAITGLVNFRMRWYDPEAGRWLSKDPIRLMGGINLYAFCNSDPLLFVDPIGLTEIDNDELTEFGFIGTIKPIIVDGDKVYPGYRFNYHPDPFGHGRLPDGSAKQPHVDQMPKRGPGKVRFDLNGNPLKGEKGVVPKKDNEAFLRAVKDVLKAIGAGAKATGVRLISVPILLCPPVLINPAKTEDGRETA